MDRQRRWSIAGVFVAALLAACSSIVGLGDPPSDGVCGDVQRDQQNCGACGRVCAVGEVCSAGVCATTCPAKQTNCNGGCTLTQTDLQNCGECGKSCAVGEQCVEGQCGCAAPRNVCGGVCADRQSDSKNCGGCGNECLTGESCVQGVCKVSCHESLRAAAKDPWGTEWDGLERAPDTLSAADAACTAIGGRLPTATEIYRVSAGQTAAVGQSTMTNWLWSLVPDSPTRQTIARLSDGVANDSEMGVTKRNYRCVCPSPPRKDFTGNACYGPPGKECFTLTSELKHRNIDMSDRAALPKGAAMWECAFARAHLADYATLAEGIMSELPNGSTAWVHTADDASNQHDTLIKWQNVQPIWQVSGNTTVAVYRDLRPFRCAGANFSAGPHPNAVPNEFIGAANDSKGETVDSPAGSIAAAYDTCVARGGHLARSTELAELVFQGLPGGTGKPIRSADQAGHDGVQFLTVSLIWTGTTPRLGYAHNGGNDGLGWVYKHQETFGFRCIYYPIDIAYQGPNDAADCNGGCQKFVLAGEKPATIWVDKADRPAALLESAIGTCRGKGGHVASERDLSEAIRKGLPNGSGTYLLTPDIVHGAGEGAGTRMTKVQWTGTDLAYDDLHTKYMTWADLTAPLAYRCMWTNELR